MSAPPPREYIHTPAYCCAPSGHGRRGACTARALSLSHSANAQPNPGPAAHPLVSRIGGKEERGRQLQRWAGTPEPPGAGAGGVQQLCFNSWQGEGEAAAQEGSRGSSTLRNREGWSVKIRREERGAHWTGEGSAGPARARDSGGKRKTVQATGAWEEGEGARTQDLGLEGRTDRPEGWEGGRPRVLGARGGVPGGQERVSLEADVLEGSAWRSSSGLGALDPKKPTWGGSCAACRGDRGRVIAGKSKWRVKLVRLPGGGEQAGECGQEHEAGQESRGGREAVGTE